MSITPGPNNLMCLYLGARGGLKNCSSFLAGSMIALTVKVLLSGFLNLLLAEKIPAVVEYLKWAGCAYMLYLAFTMIRAGFKKEETGEAKNGESTFAGGVLLQLLNAKSYIAALSIFSVYVIPYTNSVGAILIASACFIFSALVCSLIWCVAGSAIQKQYEKYRLPICIVLALSLIWCAWTVIKP